MEREESKVGAFPESVHQVGFRQKFIRKRHILRTREKNQQRNQFLHQEYKRAKMKTVILYKKQALLDRISDYYRIKEQPGP